jgi:hypothetical protein
VANPALATPTAVNAGSATYGVAKFALDRPKSASVELATRSSAGHQASPGFVSLGRPPGVNAGPPGSGTENGSLAPRRSPSVRLTGVVRPGARVGITAGLPSGRPGTTSLMQIQRV